LPDESDPQQAILRVSALVAGYGKKIVLNGVSLSIGAGEVVAVIGHNGAGKSTLLKAIYGLIPLRGGQVAFRGASTVHLTPNELLQQGIAYVPQGNRVFSSLTVRENLEVSGLTAAAHIPLNERLRRTVELFPALKFRMQQKAGDLSGGEKQMLALATALAISPRLLLLDEPSLGLAPASTLETLKRIQQISKCSGAAVVIVEQKIKAVLTIAQRAYVLRNGRVSYSGLSEELSDDSKLREVFL
jgi:branched-chain amino acid transport system ATP-binding protein